MTNKVNIRDARRIKFQQGEARRLRIGSGRWTQPASLFPLATGGTVVEYEDSQGLNWRAHIFTDTGQLTVIEPGAFDYLVVGAGGSIGNRGISFLGNQAYGGAGAGQAIKYVTGEAGNNASGPAEFGVGTVEVTVAPETPRPPTGTGIGPVNGFDGQPSTLGTITAVGGTRGRGDGAGFAGYNASGGSITHQSSSTSVTVPGGTGVNADGGGGEGKNDIAIGGGGAGQTGPGVTPVLRPEPTVPEGGPGLLSSITGIAVTYSRGGQGTRTSGTQPRPPPEQPGWGGGQTPLGSTLGLGAGAAGIVVVRYRIA